MYLIFFINRKKFKQAYKSNNEHKNQLFVQIRFYRTQSCIIEAQIFEKITLKQPFPNWQSATPAGYTKWSKTVIKVAMGKRSNLMLFHGTNENGAAGILKEGIRNSVGRGVLQRHRAALLPILLRRSRALRQRGFGFREAANVRIRNRLRTWF